MKTCKSTLLLGWLIAGLLFSPAFSVAETQTTDLWYPYAEWSFDNIQYSGNAFDIDAIATFSDGKDVGLFYDGGRTWKLRYMCTEPGTYNFSVSSGNSSLNGLSGTVVCSDTVGSPGPLVPGGPNQSLFYDPAIGQPVIPAWGMIPSILWDNPTDAQMNQWFDNHIASRDGTAGAHFRGAHFQGPANGWYDHTCDGTRAGCDSLSPDPETFRRYETVFARLAEYNAFAHFWMFWDCQRDKCDKFHNDRKAQLRLRKYIARRWGAISNWMVGEGFDNFEDDSTEYANQWYRDLTEHMPWFHFIGMRGYKNNLDRVICTECNYRSYESQEQAGKMTYERWNASREASPAIPVFEEDRYRYGNYSGGMWKGPQNAGDQITYLWGQAMNLGIGAIYGYLENTSKQFSRYEGYPDDWETGIRAWHQFWYATPTDPFHRFLSGMEYCNNLSSDSKGICKPGEAYIFYRDGGSSIQFDISGLTAASAPAVAVNAKTGEFYDLGYFPKAKTSWIAPGNSNWALAIGSFPGAEDLVSAGEPGVLPPPSDLRIVTQ